MIFSSLGISTNIWNKRILSVFLFMIYPIIIMISVGFIGGVWGFCFSDEGFLKGYQNVSLYFGLPLLILWGVWIAINRLRFEDLIRSSCHIVPADRRQEPRLFSMVEELSILSGIPMPKILIIGSRARNAFSFALKKNQSWIVVTQGILSGLEKEELKAVLAQELAQIKLGDTILLSRAYLASSFFVKIFYNICYIPCIFMNSKGISYSFFVSVLVSFLIYCFLWIFYIFTQDMQQIIGTDIKPHISFAALVFILIGIACASVISSGFVYSIAVQNKEYQADSEAIRMTKNPDAMIRVLISLSAGSNIDTLPEEIKHLCFVNTAQFLWHRSHPDLANRVRLIARMTNSVLPDNIFVSR